MKGQSMTDKQLIAELLRIAEGSKSLWPAASPTIKEAAQRLKELAMKGK
jgi:hypothetical protein